MTIKPYLLFTLVLSFSQSLLADDTAQLTQLLNDFLKGTDKAEQHDRFWAQDLIYTSSSGSRFGKADIMAGFAPSDDDEQGRDTAVQSYSAENIDIRLFGTTAVVAFKLVGVGTEKGETHTSYYFNTGTFVKRAGQWRAVAWQATKIPEPD